MHTSRKPTPNLKIRRQTPLRKPPLTINNQTISEVHLYKYLGILVDSQLRWKEQDQRAIANATKWPLQYRRLMKPSTGTSAKLMRQLYLSVALPKITYGLDVWFTPPNKEPGQTKNLGSSTFLCQLQKTQRITLLEITSTLCTTPNEFVDAHAGILPIDLTLHKATHRALIRLLTLPPSHPLHDIIISTKGNPPQKYASPIANLLRIHKLSNIRIETITPKSPTTTHIHQLHNTSSQI